MKRFFGLGLSILSVLVFTLHGFLMCAFADPQPLSSGDSTKQIMQPPLVRVKGDCFEMGDVLGIGDYDEKPVHKVCLKDFYIGKFEVTNAEFEAFIRDTDYVTTAEEYGLGWAVSREGMTDWDFRKGVNWRHPLWPNDDISGRMNHPVLQISWYDADKYVAWLRKTTGKPFRLPTEAEWEYAARNGGKTIRYGWGDGEPSASIADETAKKKFPNWDIWAGYDDGNLFTTPVGSFHPNELGIYDMVGNAWEWVSDRYREDYYQFSMTDNPLGPNSGEDRCVRGGAWISGPEDLRITIRSHNDPIHRDDITGFRIARSAK